VLHYDLTNNEKALKSILRICAVGQQKPKSISQTTRATSLGETPIERESTEDNAGEDTTREADAREDNTTGENNAETSGNTSGALLSESDAKPASSLEEFRALVLMLAAIIVPQEFGVQM
jgi:hypothetical protein